MNRRSVRLVAMVMVLGLGAVEAKAQGRPGATVTGRVREAESGAPVPGAIVSIEGTTLLKVADAEGRYRLERVPPGPQVLLARRIGFAPARVPITVGPTGELVVDVTLAHSALRVSGIIVTADPAGRARGELATASVVDREAIANQTAASLQGVLELTPGVPLSPPGLENTQQFAIRTAPAASPSLVPGVSAADLASFGTLIVLDDVPLSNNANLQTTGSRGELNAPTTAGGGIDLRLIPATTIERVEVIRGVPSVRYGDLTAGAIVVETRAEAVAPELATRYDARTLEASLVGGRTLGGGQAATLTGDVAQTRPLPGIRKDEILRFNFQLAHRANLGRLVGDETTGARLVLDTRLDLTHLVEDSPEDSVVQPGYATRARDTHLRLSERARLNLRSGGSLSLTFALDHTRQRSFVTERVVRGAMPFTDRLTEGRQEGRFVIGQYQARVDLEGDPWLIYGRFEADGTTDLFGLEHRLRAGAEWRREWNGGPGYKFDILYPPQVRFNGVLGFDRPRRFDLIPPVATSALYLDDRFTTALPAGASLDVQAGLRLDLLHSGSTWLSGVRSALLAPRLTAQLSARPWLRLRASAGRTAKTPTVGDLYPAPQYYDVINVNWYANDPAERLAVMTTFIRDPTNPDLGFSRGRKAEAGIEVGGGRGGTVSFVAFSDRTDGAVGIRSTPSYLLREHFDLVDSTQGTGQPPRIIEPASYSDTVPIQLDQPANIMFLRNRGYELTASFPEIRALRTRLDVQAAWVKTTLEKHGVDFSVRFGDFQLAENQQRAPYWDGVTRYGQRTIVTTRLVHHQPRLGMAITVTIQHLLNEERYDIAGTDSLAFAGYITRAGVLVPVPPEQRADSQYADLHVSRTGLVSQPYGPPDDWLLSVQLSKTLPLGGRLSFYAFNAFDRPGKYATTNFQPRPFAAVRFGVEMTMPLAGVVEAVR